MSPTSYLTAPPRGVAQRVATDCGALVERIWLPWPPDPFSEGRAGAGARNVPDAGRPSGERPSQSGTRLGPWGLEAGSFAGWGFSAAFCCSARSAWLRAPRPSSTGPTPGTRSVGPARTGPASTRASSPAARPAELPWTGPTSTGPATRTACPERERSAAQGSTAATASRNSSPAPAIPAGWPSGGGRIYWSNTAPAGGIGRAKLNGSGVQRRFVPTDGYACGVAVDRSHLYWANRDAGTIGRANLNGKRRRVRQGFIRGGNDICGVAVNRAHIYWADRASDSIGRANIDGKPSSVKTSFIRGRAIPAAWRWTVAGSTGRTRSAGRSAAPTSTAPGSIRASYQPTSPAGSRRRARAGIARPLSQIPGGRRLRPPRRARAACRSRRR